jgi:hypothetical protein
VRAAASTARISSTAAGLPTLAKIANRPRRRPHARVRVGALGLRCARSTRHAPDLLQPGIFSLPDALAWLRPFGITGAVTLEPPVRLSNDQRALRKILSGLAHPIAFLSQSRTSGHYQRIFCRSFEVYPDRVGGLYRPAYEFPFIRRIGFSVFVYELLAVADAIYLTFQA